MTWGVVRTPLLPLADVLGADSERLQALAARPEVRDALWLCSPDLVAALDRGERTRKLDLALLRYLLRIAGRPTPFGLCAGWTLAEVGDPQLLELSGDDRPFSRLTPAATTKRGLLRANPTIYEAGGRLRYIEPRPHRLVAAEPDDALRAALAAASGGATREDVAHAVAGDDVPLEDALEYVDELIDAGLLVSGLVAVISEASPPAAALGSAPHGTVQVDLQRGGTMRIPASSVAALERAVEVLRRLSPGREPPDLVRFRDAFWERYGTRTVPLAEALDPETGIGFPTSPEGAEPRWGEAEQLLARLATSGAREIDLADIEQDILELEPAPLPAALCLNAQLSSDGEVRLIGYSGPSGVRLLGRFCHQDDQLRSRVEEHLRAEEALDPEAVFAEIAHLPDDRTANLVARPRLRAHEIVLMAGSTGGGEEILLADLDLSFEQGALVLRSRRLGRRVVPRLTAAHNIFGPGLGIYRFLAQLQHQGAAPGASFSWGPLAQAAHLPRVRLGDVVLAPERWTLPARDLPGLVAVEHGESALPVDLTTELGRALLEREPPGTVVTELWPGPERLPVAGPHGRHVGELLLPRLADRNVSGNSSPKRSSRPVDTVRRTFAPGSSEWSYLKLYGGPAALDAIVARDLLGLPGAWHFIRYKDPDLHLRVRVPGPPDALLALSDRLAREGLVWRAQLDTYEREVERYGGPEGIVIAEQAFHADSRAVATLIAGQPPGEEAANQRPLLAVGTVAHLLRDLGYPEAQATPILTALKDQFAGATTRREFADHVRAHRRTLEHILEHALNEPPNPELPRTPPEVAFALTHIHVNRLLRTDPNLHEPLVYDALERLLISRQARAKTLA